MKHRYPQSAEAVSAFEAKTHLSELLRETERGKSYLIKRHGRPVARLIPAGDPSRTDFKALSAAFRDIRSRVRGKVSVKALIAEGRRA